MSKTTVGAAAQHMFSKIPAPKVGRSLFDLSKGNKLTMDAGKLVPVYCIEVLPGDTHKATLAIFGRLATMIKPIMDDIIIRWEWFFHPNRLAWEHWENLQGFRPEPTSSVDYVVPWLSGAAGVPYEVLEGDLGDYLGLPLGEIDPDILETSGYHISALPFRMYRNIWNKWYRDQNYQGSVTVSLGDGPDTYSSVSQLLPRNKPHDYFSSSLPSPQKGPAVPIPFEGMAPVWGDGAIRFQPVGDDTPIEYLMSLTDTRGHLFQSIPSGVPNDTPWQVVEPGVVPSGLSADVSAVAASLNALRQSFVIQQMYELDARGGTRYVELLYTRFGVVSPDFRLDRPEFLGSGKTKLAISAVPQTSPTSGDNVQAGLAAYGTAGATGSISYNANEHGYLFCFVSITAPLTYQQKIERHWLRATRFDFYEPLTNGLGEQAVMTSEIFYPSPREQVWGYQERWAEYRYSPSQVTGQFRSLAAQSLDLWHLALDYEVMPEMDSEWVKDDPPIDRVIAQPSQPQFIVDTLVKNHCARAMPVYSVPGLRRM